jgi:hypothetical protein
MLAGQLQQVLAAHAGFLAGAGDIASAPVPFI